jgi:hypothetical protein
MQRKIVLLTADKDLVSALELQDDVIECNFFLSMHQRSVS